MALKSTEVTRAEYLTPEERKELKVDKGLIIVETRNPNLRNELKVATQGYSVYLKSLGEYEPSTEDWGSR